MAEAVHKALDEDSDGSVTMQQFSFIIESQVQRQRNYRQIMGQVESIDPIDIEAKIIDMRSKIRYMEDKLSQG